jgi:large conductance mechanosensitive channel
MIKEFKAFILRGNLVEIAVAFILGLAFAAVVTGFTSVILGVISYVAGGKVSFDKLGVHKGSSAAIVIPYGAFITALLNFLIVAFVLFMVIKAYKRVAPKKVPTKQCEFCKSEIALDATRCPDCTSELAPA